MRTVRHKRLRKKIFGTTERPRLAVYRSNKHLSAQIIDDVNGVTLASVSSMEKDLKAGDNAESAEKLGKTLADRAKKAGISSVVFDRGGYQYHGTIAKLADSAREGGLEF
jgi:large subunit ribosomal protein L18